MAIKEVNKKPITDKQLVKSKFWSKFNSYSQASVEFCKELTPHPYADTRKYHDYSVGHGAYHLTLSVDFQKETCAVGVYFRDVESWDVYYSEYRETIEGNILRDDFTEVWKNGFKIFRTPLSQKNEKCASCASVSFCEGGSCHSWDYDNNKPLVCFKDVLF